MTTDLTLTDAQLRVLRSLQRGWPAELDAWLLGRNGASPEEWSALAEAGLVEQAAGRWVLTPAGRRTYGRAKKGRWF